MVHQQNMMKPSESFPVLYRELDLRFFDDQLFWELRAANRGNVRCNTWTQASPAPGNGWWLWDTWKPQAGGENCGPQHRKLPGDGPCPGADIQRSSGNELLYKMINHHQSSLFHRFSFFQLYMRWFSAIGWACFRGWVETSWNQQSVWSIKDQFEW